MSTAEERMQNAIEELEQENRLLRARNDRLEAEANAAPVQEPVAQLGDGILWCDTCRSVQEATHHTDPNDRDVWCRGEARWLQGPFYTTPPAAQRQWVGLTEEQKLSLEIQGGKSDVMLAELVEGWLKEKNS